MLTKSDPAFHIRDSTTITARAGLKISQRCPENERMWLENAIGYGWIQPVAYVREDELMWIQLKEEN
jgi:hypothetical protein